VAAARDQSARAILQTDGFTKTKILLGHL